MYSAEDKWRLVALYESGQTIDYCAQEAGVSYATMKGNLRRWGANIRRRGPRRKYTLNEHYFQRIYDQGRAYWLGFVLAHGHIGQTGAGNKFLRVELGIQDAYHLSAFASFLGYTGQAQYSMSKGKYGSTYLTLNSTKMVEDLSKYSNLSTVDKSLLPHALRGYFDGRGQLEDQRLVIVGDPQILTMFDQIEQGSMVENPVRPSLVYTSIIVIERLLKVLYTDAQIFLLRKKLMVDKILGV